MIHLFTLRYYKRFTKSYIFFFKQKECRGNPLHYPKYIKHKIKDSTKLGGHQPDPVNLFVTIKDNTINSSYKWF
jgi:hypothetical protein